MLKDRTGVAQFLLMPADRITGMEDPAILAPSSTNYWAEAWRARRWMAARLGRPVPREAVSLAVNSRFGRTQNQLHIHIDCVRRDVARLLREHPGEPDGRWHAVPGGIDGKAYRILWLSSEHLVGWNPFRLLADGMNVEPSRMGWHTLVVVAARLRDGSPGFAVLEDEAGRTLLDPASGEVLQDHACGILEAER